MRWYYLIPAQSLDSCRRVSLFTAPGEPKKPETCASKLRLSGTLRFVPKGMLTAPAEHETARNFTLQSRFYLKPRDSYLDVTLFLPPPITAYQFKFQLLEERSPAFLSICTSEMSLSSTSLLRLLAILYSTVCPAHHR